jgi:hypothetical protein
MDHGVTTKRTRTQQQDILGGSSDTPGRAQLLLAPELQTCLGQHFCDETALLSLLLARGLVRRVNTICIEVRPLGGGTFKITLDASVPTVGEAKAEIARTQGITEAGQVLYKVAQRADGLAVREDDADPELLENESTPLGDGEVIAMAVKELPLMWRTFAKDRVTLSESGTVATQILSDVWSLTTSGIELTEGSHYWEVKLLSGDVGSFLIGVSRPNLNPVGQYYGRDCTDGWFINRLSGSLFGNGKRADDQAGGYKQGDRVGVLLDLDSGSIRFFRNSVEHGPGYPAGSVTSPVVHATQICYAGSSVRLLPDAEMPVGM